MSVDGGELPAIGTLSINDNKEGWGPCDIPNEFKDMPYQPFSKDTRLGKVADWSGCVYPDAKSKNRYTPQFGGGGQYAYFHDEDDSNFQVVSATKDNRPPYFRQRFKFQPRFRRGGGPFTGGYGGRGTSLQSLGRKMTERERLLMQQQHQRRWGGGNFGGAGANWQGNRRGWQGGNWRQNDYRRQNRAPRDASVQIKDSWTLLEELEFTRFVNLALPNVKEATTLVKCGKIKIYDKMYDQVTTRTSKPLARVNRVIHTVTSTEDPVIRRLAREAKGNVFCTDRMAAAIMCSPKSVDSWDLLAIRVGDFLFFDLRPDSDFGLITVGETAVEPPMEESTHMNSSKNLSLEATYINANFPQQVLKSNVKGHTFPEKNPFIDSEDEDEAEEEVASVGYLYRHFDLGGNINLVVRCEVDAALPPEKDSTDKELRCVCIKALNEFDSRYCNGVDWRAKLDVQRGAVLASELRNNAYKLAKWTVCSLLAGADQLKLGFVSRANSTDTSHHVILGVQRFKPNEFAKQLNLNMENAWGVLRSVIDYFMKCEAGQYIMVKDPNKPLIAVYSLPQNAFDSDDGEYSDATPAKAKNRPAATSKFAAD